MNVPRKPELVDEFKRRLDDVTELNDVRQLVVEEIAKKLVAGGHPVDVAILWAETRRAQVHRGADGRFQIATLASGAKALDSQTIYFCASELAVMARARQALTPRGTR